MDGTQGNPDFNEDCLGRVNVLFGRCMGVGLGCTAVGFPSNSVTLHPGATLCRAWGMMPRDAAPCRPKAALEIINWNKRGKDPVV